MKINKKSLLGVAAVALSMTLWGCVKEKVSLKMVEAQVSCSLYFQHGQAVRQLPVL
jgi:hypothetical protein